MSIKFPHSSLKLSIACVILFVLLGQAASHARPGTTATGSLSDFNISAYLEEVGGGYQDLFAKLNRHKVLSSLYAKHGLNDPAVWPALERRYTLRLAESSKQLTEAEAMIETKDRRSGLDGSIISAESVRAQGRALHDELSVEIAEMQQALRLINELKSVLQLVESEHALTNTITLSSVNAENMSGQVLLVDRNDLIVKHENGGYFRVPAEMLSQSTKLSVLDSIFSRWSALPHLVKDEEVAEKNAGDLIAYSDDLLYIIDRYEGLVSEDRADSQFAFVPYDELIDALKADDTRNAYKTADKTAQLKDYEEGLALNNMRIKAIAWYESRLGTQFVLSQREKANAHREELNTLEKAETDKSSADAPVPDDLVEGQAESAESAERSDVSVESEVSSEPDKGAEEVPAGD